MRHILLALAVLIGGALTAGAADDGKYTSKEGKYTVQFPAGADVKPDKRKTETGGEMFGAKAVVEGQAYLVFYTDLSDEFKKRTAKELFDGGEASLKKGGGEVEDSTEFKFGADKLPARDLTLTSKGLKVKIRTVVAGARVYHLYVGGTKDFITSKEAAAFLDSFKITK